MKSIQIGVIGNPDSWYVSELCRVGISRGHVVRPLLFPEFRSRITSGRIQFTCGHHDGTTQIDLRSLDVLIVRTMPPGTLEQVVARMDLLAGLESCGVRILNPPKSLECAVDKYLTTQRLALAGLPVPATIVCESSDAALLAFEDLGRDVVVKPLFGAEGRGILRVSDPDLALRAFRTLERLGAVLYLQEFLSGPAFDIRVLLLNGQLVGSMKRTPKPGDFRANISQQGTGTPHSPSELELQLSRQAAVVTSSLFAGVDIMYDHDQQPRIIEVNAVPGWRGLQNACGVDVADRLFGWLETGSCAD